ncbi:hypothetical protein D3C87_1304050 [compost metagenome]
MGIRMADLFESGSLHAFELYEMGGSALQACFPAPLFGRLQKVNFVATGKHIWSDLLKLVVLKWIITCTYHFFSFGVIEIQPVFGNE